MHKITFTCVAVTVASAFVWAASYEQPAAQTAPAPRAAAQTGAPAKPWQPAKRKDGQPDIEGIYQSVTNEGGGAGSREGRTPDGRYPGGVEEGTGKEVVDRQMKPFLTFVASESGKKRHEQAVQTILSACLAHKVVCGLPPQPQEVEMRIKQGFRFILDVRRSRTAP